MKKRIYVFSLIVFVGLACRAIAPVPPTAVATIEEMESQTKPPATYVVNLPAISVVRESTAPPVMPELPTNTAIPTDTALPTEIPTPTSTLPPTQTPTPTQTSTPTITPTTPYYPIVLSGSGSRVLEIRKWLGPGIARITHTGDSYFTVESFDKNNRHLAFLVDVVGNYIGTVPVDFDDTETTRMIVNADGSWGLQILPLFSAQILAVPGIVSGNGDTVLILVGDTPDKILADASKASGDLIIQVYDHEPEMVYLGLVANDTAPFSGVFVLPNGASLLAITAEGSWKLEITER